MLLNVVACHLQAKLRADQVTNVEWQAVPAVVGLNTSHCIQVIIHCTSIFCLASRHAKVFVEQNLLGKSASKFADVVELQQQFEQDKKKIAEWRASRKFKPY